MTAKPSIDPARLLEDQLASASPDLLRCLLTTFLDALMSADTDVACGAPYRVRGPERVNVRNGYRHRDFDTRACTLDLAIPRLRSGSYFPDWLTAQTGSPSRRSNGPHPAGSVNRPRGSQSRAVLVCPVVLIGADPVAAGGRV